MAAPLGAPPWFASVNVMLVNIQNGVVNIQNDVTLVRAELNNKRARKRGDQVQGLPDAAGNVPPVFPCTVAHLHNMNKPAVVALYNLYYPGTPLLPADPKLKYLRKIFGRLVHLRSRKADFAFVASCCKQTLLPSCSFFFALLFLMLCPCFVVCLALFLMLLFLFVLPFVLLPLLLCCSFALLMLLPLLLLFFVA